MCLIKLSIALLDATFLKDHTGSRGIFKTHFRALQRGEWILLSQCCDQRFLHWTSASVTFRQLWWNTMAKAVYRRKNLGLMVPKRTGYQVFKYVSLWQSFLVQATTTLITFQKFFLQSQPPAGVHWDFNPEPKGNTIPGGETSESAPLSTVKCSHVCGPSQTHIILHVFRASECGFSQGQYGVV